MNGQIVQKCYVITGLCQYSLPKFDIYQMRTVFFIIKRRVSLQKDTFLIKIIADLHFFLVFVVRLLELLLTLHRKTTKATRSTIKTRWFQ